MRFGQHPAPDIVLAHLSDSHLLAGGAPLAGVVDTEQHLRDAVARLEQGAPDLDAIVVSGDVADLGEPAAYRLAAEIIEPLAARLGIPVIWTAGNHDERAPMRAALGLPGSGDAPIDGVTDVRGLRIVALDSSVAGWHHGGFEPGQAEWLQEVLSEPAPLGTVLVMHHPPLPYRSELMRILEFRNEDRLADVLAGSDVRAILSGHLHVNGSGTFAGIPVILASATSYADDLGAPPSAMHGIDATQSINLIEFSEHGIAHSVLPALQHEFRDSVPAHLHAELQQLDAEARLARFSRKPHQDG